MNKKEILKTYTEAYEKLYLFGHQGMFIFIFADGSFTDPMDYNSYPQEEYRDLICSDDMIDRGNYHECDREDHREDDSLWDENDEAWYTREEIAGFESEQYVSSHEEKILSDFEEDEK